MTRRALALGGVSPSHVRSDAADHRNPDAVGDRHLAFSVGASRRMGAACYRLLSPAALSLHRAGGAPVFAPAP